MRLLHVPFTYFPSPCGGTEVYVLALCRELREAGVENVIAAPDRAASFTTFEGTHVHRFPIHPAPTLDILYSDGDPTAAASFARVLDQTAPNLVHFHARSPAVSHLCLQEVHQRGIPTVFTYHTPTASCNRGTLMRWGTQPCDGVLRPALCAACHLHSLGIPKPLALGITALSAVTRHLGRWLPPSARWQVPARALPIARARHAVTRQWFAGMDRIVALNAWTERMLQLNGVTPGQLRKVRHGLTQVPPAASSQAARAPGDPLRLVFLGRLDPIKGIDVLLNALALAPELNVELHIFTIVEESPGPRVLALQQRLASESRVRICKPVPPGSVIETLRQYDALLVPSQWLETGPLVVLEAFAAGIPVLGADLGGITEWVHHEHDGLLLPARSAEAWAAAFRRLSSEPHLLPALRQKITPPRSMRQVALEMLDIYRELLPPQLLP